MSKNKLIMAGIFLSLILFTGCDNATNNINRAANYNPNVTSENGSTFDFIGRFFNNWEDGKVTNDCNILKESLEEKNDYIEYLIKKNDLTLKYDLFKKMMSK